MTRKKKKLTKDEQYKILYVAYHMAEQQERMSLRRYTAAVKNYIEKRDAFFAFMNEFFPTGRSLQ